MAETLPSTEDAEVVESINLETIRSRLKALSEMRENLFNPPDSSLDDPNKFLEDCTIDFQEKVVLLEAEERYISSLGPDELETYIERLKTELCSAETENSIINTEFDTLAKTVVGDSVQLDGDIEGLTCSLNIIDSQVLHHLCSTSPNGTLFLGDTYENPLDSINEYKFEILELSQRIEKNKNNLIILQDLDYALQRFEAVGQIEDMFSEVQVIDFQGTCIRLSLKTPIPNTDGLFLGRKLDIMESSMAEHELLIELTENTMQLKNVEIFPDDIFIDGIVDTIKSARDPISSTLSPLRWFIRKVQHRIVLCSLRRLLVKEANKSRHSFEYSDRDDTITAHLVGGIDAFIKLAQDWPISSHPLKLLSIKNRDHQSKGITLSFLCKAKELANSLDMQSRLHLARFADTIEGILLQEMQSQLHSNSSTA